MIPPVAESTLEQIKAELRAGKKIGAIKILREASGMSLKDAKEAVEKLHAELHAKDPQQYPLIDGKGCGFAAIAVLLVIMVALGVLLFLRS